MEVKLTLPTRPCAEGDAKLAVALPACAWYENLVLEPYSFLGHWAGNGLKGFLQQESRVYTVNMYIVKYFYD